MFVVAHASDQSTWQVTNVTRVELSSKSDLSVINAQGALLAKTKVNEVQMMDLG